MAKKILIVDDEPELVTMIANRLEASGYEAISAFDGESGLKIMESDRPDLVLLDVRMPKMDGYTFVKKTRVNKEIRDIPIIMLTAVDKLKDIFELEGVKDYIVKPFDTKVLVEKVNKCLRSERFEL